ncbi:MAG: GNAT family N-acetyltransferase [Caulobacteraceae bacterium]
MRLRAAARRDHRAIAEVVSAAFGQATEAEIIEAVRSEGAVVAEVVAEDDGVIVGHALFSRMGVIPARFVAALAPLAVRPNRQRQGVGSALTRAGVVRCAEAGAEAVVVLGHPAYYPRFGFSPAAAAKLASPYADRPAFMALELREGALDAPLAVAYPKAFGSGRPP